MLPLLDRSSSIPLYEQLYEFYVQAIFQQKIKKGYKLPSVRRHATDLGVSKNTVVKAYDQLINQGFVSNKPKKGVFVSRPDPLYGAAKPALPAGGSTHGSGKKETIYNLGHSVVDEQYFPMKEWRQVQQLALDHLAHQYDFEGERSGLKEQLIRYLYYSRGVSAKKSRSSSQRVQTPCSRLSHS